MSTVKFILKNDNKDGLSSIFLLYQQNGKRFKYSTRLKTFRKDWTKSSRVQIRKDNEKSAKQINLILDDLQNRIAEIEREGLFFKKEYDINTVRKKFYTSIGHLAPVSGFFALLDQYIEESRPVKAIGTIKNYIVIKNKLLEYETARNVKLSIENIDKAFYDDFIQFLIVDKGLLNNSVGKDVKNLKAFLNYCISKDLIPPMKDLNAFKVFKEAVDIIYITEEELLDIYNLRGLPDYLDRVKDNFCFGCFTGLRFSDIAKLSLAHIKNGFVEIRTEKTRDSLKIPLVGYAKDILKKYENKFSERPLPVQLANQKTNEYLKMIAQRAGLNSTIELEKYTGSKKVIINKAKYEFVTTHTARRTFVTLSLEKGMRPEVVMQITGHKDYRTFQRYIKITDSIKLIEMSKAWNNNNFLKVV